MSHKLQQFCNGDGAVGDSGSNDSKDRDSNCDGGGGNDHDGDNDCGGDDANDGDNDVDTDGGGDRDSQRLRLIGQSS